MKIKRDPDRHLPYGARQGSVAKKPRRKSEARIISSDSAEYRVQGFMFNSAVRTSALNVPFGPGRTLHDMLATTAIADSEGAAVAKVGYAASMEEMP